MRQLTVLLLIAPTSAALSLRAKVEELEVEKSACSACNLISKMLDAEKSLSSRVVTKWKESSSEQRSKMLRTSLKKACSKLDDMEIAATSGRGTRTFFDRFELRKQNMGASFEGAETGPGVNAVVVELCELLVTEATPTFVARMEEWMGSKKGRRLVDFRFHTDLGMCAGGVLNVCDGPSSGDGKLEQSAEDDDDEDDDREL